MNLYVKTYSSIAALFCAMQQLLKLFKNKRLLMRISILAILLTLSGLLMAGTGSGQDLNKTVSLDIKNVSLKQALRKI